MAKVDIKDWQAKHGTAMAAITTVEAALQDIPSSVMGPRKPDVFARNQAAKTHQLFDECDCTNFLSAVSASAVRSLEDRIQLKICSLCFTISSSPKSHACVD